MKRNKPMASTPQAAPGDIDEYISRFPQTIQEVLQKVRMTIKKAAPEAEETIRYNMPTFYLHGHYLIYFAAFKKHISLYPAPVGSEQFGEEIEQYASGKGTLQFPLDKPIPYGLITKLVKFRAKENIAKAKTKEKK
jgi:uncharacterized protein YdhG (YjbR/CyaY superfamily)